MIYIDMDGVVADFEKAVIDKTGSTIAEHIEAKQWDVVKKTFMCYDTFISLEPMPLMDVLKNHVGKFKILTATGYINEDDVKKAKLEWLCNHLEGFDERDFKAVPKSHEKAEYAVDIDDILVDDREKSIRPWTSEGGTGILFTNSEYEIRAVNRLLESVTL